MKLQSESFIESFGFDTMHLHHRVIMEFGSNRFNDGQVVTATGTKLVTRDIETSLQENETEFWRAEDVFNNKNRNTMKWLVCDAGATVAEEETGQGYRCITLDSDADYERGWWSDEKSDGSGEFASGGPAVSSSFFENTIYSSGLIDVQEDLEDPGPGEKASKQSAYIQNDPSDAVQTPYGRMINRITLYTTEGYPNMKDIRLLYLQEDTNWFELPDFELGENEYEYTIDFPEDIEIFGLGVKVLSTREPNDYARISEVNAYLVKDISDDVISIDVSETREEYDNSTVPIGRMVANTCDLELQNTDLLYNIYNEDSPYARYLNANVRFTVEIGIDMDEGVDTPAYEYADMGEFWTDDWSSDSGSMNTSVSARDFSKFLQDDADDIGGHLWLDTNIKNVFSTLLLFKGFAPDKIDIDESHLRDFPVIFINDKTSWELMDELSLADQGTFGFDTSGRFYYHSYKKLLRSPYTSSVYDLSDTTNIIDGSLRSELYANSVTVEVSPYNTEETGTRKVWSPPSPQILSWSKVAGTLDPEATIIPVQQAQRQTSESLDDNGWPEYNGYIFLPVFDDDLTTVLSGELIKYKRRTDTEFLDCERGYLDTPAIERTDAYLGEARLYDIEFDNTPVLNSRYPFVTVIDSLLEIPEEGVPQAHVVYYERNAFTAKLVLGNTARYFTWLMGKGQTVRDYDDEEFDTEIDFATSIAGVVAVKQDDSEKVREALEDPLAENTDLIRRYGKNPITISNDWIQSRNHAQEIANIIVDEYKHPRQVLDLDIIGFPALELGDRVRITSFPQMSIANKEYHIIEMDHSYDGTLSTSVVLRQVKMGS